MVIFAAIQVKGYKLESVPRVFILVITLTVLLDIVIIAWLATDFETILPQLQFIDEFKTKTVKVPKN